MPTGYTTDLNDGKLVTFQEFTMKCARAFGHLIELRDEPDATIPDEFKPSNYHFDKIEAAKKRLAKIEKWNNSQAEKEAKKAFDDEVRSSKEYGEKDVQTGRAYIAMIKHVGRWLPPTKDHEGLKSFMIEQLAESLEHDCLYFPTMPQRLSGEQYRKSLLKSVRCDIAYHTKEHAKELHRVAGRNKWVRDLRQSLKDFK